MVAFVIIHSPNTGVPMFTYCQSHPFFTTSQHTDGNHNADNLMLCSLTFIMSTMEIFKKHVKGCYTCRLNWKGTTDCLSIWTQHYLLSGPSTTYCLAVYLDPALGCPWGSRFHWGSPSSCLQCVCCRRGWSGSASLSSTESPLTGWGQTGGWGCPPPQSPCEFKT